MKRNLAIVGRPNVGKSTLFNRLAGARSAITDDISGVTRDRIIGQSDWNGYTFNIMDTGGYVPKASDIFETAIRDQVMEAIAQADLLIFMVDVDTGITDADEYFAEIIRKSGKKTVMAVNKVDNHRKQTDAYGFYKLGIDPVFFISSEHGSGTGDMLDKIIEMLDYQNDPEEEPEDDFIPRFAVLGRPNAGKSTLVNSLLGEERHLVTEIPGTTRDAINSLYKKYDRTFYLVDTAGLRKKSKVTGDLEYYSVSRAIKALEDSHICLLVIDATLGIESQDLKILSLALERKKGIVLLVNKWDLVDKETNTAKDFADDIREKTQPFTDYHIVFISALEKTRILKVVDTALEVFENRSRKIPVPQLNNALKEITTRSEPPSIRGKFVKFKYITQLRKGYPHFVIFTNFPKHIKPPYRRYVENEFRKRFDFKGVPITFTFRKS